MLKLKEIMKNSGRSISSIDPTIEILTNLIQSLEGLESKHSEWLKTLKTCAANYESSKSSYDFLVLVFLAMHSFFSGPRRRKVLKAFIAATSLPDDLKSIAITMYNKNLSKQNKIQALKKLLGIYQSDKAQWQTAINAFAISFQKFKPEFLQSILENLLPSAELPEKDRLELFPCILETVTCLQGINPKLVEKFVDKIMSHPDISRLKPILIQALLELGHEEQEVSNYFKDNLSTLIKNILQIDNKMRLLRTVKEQSSSTQGSSPSETVSPIHNGDDTESSRRRRDSDYLENIPRTSDSPNSAFIEAGYLPDSTLSDEVPSQSSPNSELRSNSRLKNIVIESFLELGMIPSISSNSIESEKFPEPNSQTLSSFLKNNLSNLILSAIELNEAYNHQDHLLLKKSLLNKFKDYLSNSDNDSQIKEFSQNFSKDFFKALKFFQDVQKTLREGYSDFDRVAAIANACSTENSPWSEHFNLVLAVVQKLPENLLREILETIIPNISSTSSNESGNFLDAVKLKRESSIERILEAVKALQKIEPSLIEEFLKKIFSKIQKPLTSQMESNSDTGRGVSSEGTQVPLSVNPFNSVVEMLKNYLQSQQGISDIEELSQHTNPEVFSALLELKNILENNNPIPEKILERFLKIDFKLYLLVFTIIQKSAQAHGNNIEGSPIIDLLKALPSEFLLTEITMIRRLLNSFMDTEKENQDAKEIINKISVLSRSNIQEHSRNDLSVTGLPPLPFLEKALKFLTSDPWILERLIKQISLDSRDSELIKTHLCRLSQTLRSEDIETVLHILETLTEKDSSPLNSIKFIKKLPPAFRESALFLIWKKASTSTISNSFTILQSVTSAEFIGNDNIERADIESSEQKKLWKKKIFEEFLRNINPELLSLLSKKISDIPDQDSNPQDFKYREHILKPMMNSMNRNDFIILKAQFFEILIQITKIDDLSFPEITFETQMLIQMALIQLQIAEENNSLSLKQIQNLINTPSLETMAAIISHLNLEKNVPFILTVQSIIEKNKEKLIDKIAEKIANMALSADWTRSHSLEPFKSSSSEEIDRKSLKDKIKKEIETYSALIITGDNMKDVFKILSTNKLSSSDIEPVTTLLSKLTGFKESKLLSVIAYSQDYEEKYTSEGIHSHLARNRTMVVSLLNNPFLISLLFGRGRVKTQEAPLLSGPDPLKESSRLSYWSLSSLFKGFAGNSPNINPANNKKQG